MPEFLFPSPLAGEPEFLFPSPLARGVRGPAVDARSGSLAATSGTYLYSSRATQGLKPAAKSLTKGDFISATRTIPSEVRTRGHVLLFTK
jgi:hypothetical protein